MNWHWPIAPAQDPTMLRRRDIALVENFQGGEQFGPEHRAAAAFIGQRRERRRHVNVPMVRPKSLSTPHRRRQPRLNVVALPHPLQQSPVFDELLPRLVDSLRCDDLLQILGEGHLVLGLPAVELDDFRQKRHLLESGLDRRRPDAARDASRRTSARNRLNSLPAAAAIPPPSGIASNGAEPSNARRLRRKGIIVMPPLSNFPNRLLPYPPTPCNRAQPAGFLSGLCSANNDIASGAFSTQFLSSCPAIPYQVREWAWAIRRIVSLRILRD